MVVLSHSLLIFSLFILAFSLEESFNLGSDDVWFIRGPPVTEYFSVGVDEELLEVPLHVSSLELRIVSKPLVERLLSLAHDVDLRHHWELDLVLLHEVGNPVVVAWLLGTKLVARISQDFEALIFVFFVHLD